MVKDENDCNEYKTRDDHFFKMDEPYIMHGYDGAPPEWALFEKANFSTQKDNTNMP